MDNYQDKITKLPKWAQQYIYQLQDENTKLQFLLKRENIDLNIKPDIIPESEEVISGFIAHKRWGAIRILNFFTNNVHHWAKGEEPNSRDGSIELYSTQTLALRALLKAETENYLSIVRIINQKINNLDNV